MIKERVFAMCQADTPWPSGEGTGQKVEELVKGLGLFLSGN